MNQILVTGSSGTIGTRLCELMRAHGMKFVGVDRRANKWQPAVNECTLLGDLCDRKLIKTLPKDVDVVIHLAANARVYNLVLDPDLALENIQAAYNVLEYCRINGIKKIIFASSREVYGNGDEPCRREDQVDIRRCESTYTASKICGEALIEAYHRCYRLDYVITRFSNVYGMYDDSDRVVPLFIRHAQEDRDLVIYGGQKMLDFTYIDDTVAGIIQCLRQFEQAKNNVFNIATGQGARIVDLARMVVEHLASRSRLVIRENRTGEVVQFVADISKAARLLQYRPATSLEEGVRKAIRWYTRHVPPTVQAVTSALKPSPEAVLPTVPASP